MGKEGKGGKWRDVTRKRKKRAEREGDGEKRK